MEVKNAPFVAINTIRCAEAYASRFEELFRTRAKAIDRLPGFIAMNVLRNQDQANEYLVVSYWESEDCFRTWLKSPEFIEGHKRGFADMQAAKESGATPPMVSRFQTFDLVCN